MPRIMSQVANPGAYTDEWDSRVRCAFETCDNPGSSHHYLIECFANVAVRLGNRQGPPGYWSFGSHDERPGRIMCAECRKKVFCCQQHKEYEEHSHEPGRYGRLPAGVNGRFL